MRCRSVTVGLWLVAAAILVPGALSAQDGSTSRIVGRVLDADDDRPVAQVTVRLVDLGRVTTSDGKGVNSLVPPDGIAGIEVYESPAATAGEFQASDSRCGVIAIWTKRE